MSICTQEELPPNVCETVKSRSSSTKARALSMVSRPRPAPFTRAATSLRLTSAEVMATGMDPRVPQKRTSTAPRSGGIEGGEGRLGEPGQRLAQRGEDVEHEGEAADLEDLAPPRAEPAHGQRPSLRLHLLGGEHEYAQADAADVLHPGQVEHDAVAPRRAASRIRKDLRLESLGRRMIDAAPRVEHDGVGKALRAQLHAPSQGSVES